MNTKATMTLEGGSGCSGSVCGTDPHHPNQSTPGLSIDGGGERILQGIALSGGIAMGKPCYYCMVESGSGNSPATTSEETERIHMALREAAEHFEEMGRKVDARLGRNAGDIFRTRCMLAKDPSLLASMESKLDAGHVTADMAVSTTLDHFEQELRSAVTAGLRERADDIVELKNFVLGCLARKREHVECDQCSHCRMGECRNSRDHILVAGQLLPGTAISTGEHTRGFVVEKGGRSSHAAILARMMNLPAVSGIPDPTRSLPPGSRLLVDGDQGRVYINPAADTLARYACERNRQRHADEEVSVPVAGFRVLASLERIDDLALVSKAGAEGIGLFRSEIEMLLKQRTLTEEEQFESYCRLLEGFSGPVCIRLLDLGADKPADWLGMPAEDNPALGCRGARLLLKHRELLQIQARALARASRIRPLKVVYPMVQSVHQFRLLHAIFEESIQNIADADLLHGVMFEVPGACLDAHNFFRHADFGLVGTNDLVQYLYAMDRTDNDFDQDGLFELPALWVLIETVVRAARESGKVVSLCGELAANPKFMQRILQAGITEASVCPRQIPTLRRLAKTFLPNQVDRLARAG